MLWKAANTENVLPAIFKHSGSFLLLLGNLHFFLSRLHAAGFALLAVDVVGGFYGQTLDIEILADR